MESERKVRSMIEASATDYLPKGRSDDTTTNVLDLNDLSDRVHSYLKEVGVTINGLFSAILSKVLHDLTGKDRCMFFATNDGRDRLPIRESVGRFAKGVPFSMGSDFEDMDLAIKRASDTVFDMMSSDQYPLWELMDEYDLDYIVRLQYDYFLNDMGDPMESGYRFVEATSDPMCDLKVSIMKQNGAYKVHISISRYHPSELAIEIHDRMRDEIRRLML